MRRLSRFILNLFGWKVSITVPDFEKCIICVAPHTSNWDFVLGKLAYSSVGRKAGFLMKSSWFFFPLGLLFRAIGGIPVNRGKTRGNLVNTLVRQFNASSRLVIAITPEGTRSRTTEWHTGFLRIAREADIPLVLGAIDYKQKLISIDKVFRPYGSIESELRRVKDFYSQFTPLYPEKFSTDESSHSAP